MRIGDRLPLRREGTRTPQKRECPGHRAGHHGVEILAAYSHSTQLLTCGFATPRLSPALVPRDRARSVRGAGGPPRLARHHRLITTYREGATAASHGLVSQVSSASFTSPVSAGCHLLDELPSQRRPRRIRSRSFPAFTPRQWADEKCSDRW
jgi:hypothetical protein